MTPVPRRVALVTGAASGIGAAIAVALARRSFDVAVNYRESRTSAEQVVADCTAAGARAILAPGDVADEVQVIRMVDTIRTSFGRLDVVCNNAGTTVAKGPKDFDQIAVEEWDRVFGTNVRGLFLVAKHTRTLLQAGQEPCMVNTASIVGLRPGAQPLPY